MEQTGIDARGIVTTRVVNASREQVFRACTDLAILAAWWGPKGFTNTFHTFDLKPDGMWDFTMHAPDGKDYNNTCVFRRIEAHALLEFDHLREMHFYKAIVTFTDVAGGTRMEWRMLFAQWRNRNPFARSLPLRTKKTSTNWNASFPLHPERTKPRYIGM